MTTNKENKETATASSVDSIELLDDYIVACHCCGCEEALQMVAHRNDKNKMVGWLFVCATCFSALKGSTLKVEVI